MSDASVPANFFHFRGEKGQLERGGPREDGTPVGRIQPGHFSFLRLMAVEIWAFYVCTNGGTCEVSCWFCVPVFEANIGAQWWNCGKMWDGGRWGKKVWIVSRWWRGRREVGERVAALNIFPFRDNRSRVSSRSCFEGSTYRSKLWLRDKFELCFVVEKKKETSLCDRYLVRFESWIRFFLLLNAWNSWN